MGEQPLSPGPQATSGQSKVGHLSKPARRQRLAWAWSIFIVLICLAPHNPGPPSAFPLDKLAHFLLFAGFGALWLGACPRSLGRIAIAGTLLGLAIEILQSQLGWGRMAEGADLLADCLGLFFALSASKIWSGARPRLR